MTSRLFNPNSDEPFTLSRSRVDNFIECQRCFYLTKRKQLSLGDFPPPVFSSFDVAQQNYFRSKKVSDLTNELPEGKFLDKDSIPGTIISKTLTEQDLLVSKRQELLFRSSERTF